MVDNFYVRDIGKNIFIVSNGVRVKKKNMEQTFGTPLGEALINKLEEDGYIDYVKYVKNKIENEYKLLRNGKVSIILRREDSSLVKIKDIYNSSEDFEKISLCLFTKIFKKEFINPHSP